MVETRQTQQKIEKNKQFTMKRITYLSGIFFAVFASISVLSSCAAKDETEQLPLAVQFCRSEMQRHPDYTTIDGNTALKWNYTHGLLCQAILDAYDYYQSDTLDCSDLYSYAKGYYEATITPDGTIYKYKKENYSLDHINAGKCLFRLYERTGDNRYLTAMQTLREQLKEHPRTSDGGFWHKKNYPYQMWLDGLYMGEPFYAQYARDFENDPTASYADVIKQFVLAAEHTKDARSGLYRHGWDEKKVQIWADKTTGQSQHVWGRALGWYTMALVDVLEILPETTPDRDKLLAILQEIFEILPQYQDPETGAWYQVPDYPEREGNYLEMSCTPMFALSIAKGVRLGYLDKKLLPVARKAYEGMLKNYVSIDDNGRVSLHEICSVAGLSDDRDGSYDYYVNQTKTVDNDPKGVGPFIMLCIEMERADRNSGNENASLLQHSGENTTPVISLQGDKIVSYGASKSARLTIATVAGQIVKQSLSGTPAADRQKNISIESLPTGTYLATLDNAGKTVTLKFHKK